MGYRYRMSQDEFAYTYEHAQARMDAHPEYADKQKQIIQAQSFFKSEKEALQAAIEQCCVTSKTMWQSPELGGCPNSGRPFYSICNWTLCVQQKQIPESGMWFYLHHLHAYLKGGTFRSPLCFQHQFSHGSRESRRCSPFLHSFFSKMLQCCNVAMLQSPFRCQRGGERIILF